MTMIVATDIVDELIQPIAAQSDKWLTMVDDYLDNLLQGFDSSKGLANIKQPLPYKVKQMAIAKCCYDICLAKFGGQTGAYFKGQDGTDRWYTKLTFYRKEMEKLENEMTLELMTGASTEGKAYTSIPISRC